MSCEHTSSALESFIPFNAPENEDRLRDVARHDLGETTELRKECLKQLRALIKENNMACITSDDFLLRFLRTKKFDVQQSFQTLRNYAKQRIAYHDVVLKLQPEIVRAVLGHNIFSILSYRDTDGRLIFFHRTGMWRKDISTDEEMAAIFILIMNYVAEKLSSQITGLVFIVDAKYLPLSHMPYLMRHMNVVKNILFVGFPLKYRMMHLINESPLFKYVTRLLDPVIPKKMKDRIHFHGKSREVLLTHIDPIILPDDLGGSLGPLSSDHLIEEIEQYLQKMKDEQQYFLDQSADSQF